MLGPKGHDRWGQDWDDILLVPLSTARARILGVSPVNARAVSAISVKIRAAEDPAQAEAQVRALLRQRHGLDVDQPDDFWMTNVVDALSAQEEASKTMQRLLAAIAASFAGWPIAVDLESALLAAALTAALGILFGFYPASRAASVSPIDALSHE